MILKILTLAASSIWNCYIGGLSSAIISQSKKIGKLLFGTINQAIRINNKPIFYKNYYSAGILTVNNLRFDLSNTKSFELIAKDIKKTSFLERTDIDHFHKWRPTLYSFVFTLFCFNIYRLTLLAGLLLR